MTNFKKTPQIKIDPIPDTPSEIVSKKVMKDYKEAQNPIHSIRRVRKLIFGAGSDS